MGKSMFTIKGNVCSERVRLGRALQKPPITQEELAKKLQFMGMEDMTPLIISRIEKNQRHVCDGELRMIAKALDVTMEWLVGDSDDIKLK
ncbi:helix-turn-helix domain-containing protein [Longicatena caecimuris]|jgi:transcriptional regulator with XRE-family HTH domain|uniref:helix-turn-helix domain-containing protein n=1 Tax=Longicatena caecimuris TaxID=1796635 RepID=UPI001D01A1E7|nr:helix-turn-helix transcriptional regulator [Longicatena caecimuris]MCB5393455.1 helix-turn-helix domain-containing protein [Longicatena caecimuris]MCB5564410.1 helix-turn-helix domain-containing protein [Longicatena caecimuris]